MLLYRFTIFTCLCFVPELVYGDFKCVCNYHPYYNVYESVAYIKTDGLIHNEVCPGEPGLNDKHPTRPLTFTNWAPNHHTRYHDEEDCVVIGPDGQWDDRRCGHYATADNLALKYGYICQYDIAPSASMVPVG